MNIASLWVFNKTSTKLIEFLFVFGLTVSHYGVSYIYLGCLAFMYLLIIISKLIGDFDTSNLNLKTANILIPISIILSWFMFTSRSLHFDAAVESIVDSMVKFYDVFNLRMIPERSGIHYAVKAEMSMLWLIYKYLNIFILVCILIELLYLIYDFLNNKFPISYTRRQTVLYDLISIYFFIIIVASTFTPFRLGFDRILKIALVILSPYAVLGFMRSMEILKKFVICLNDHAKVSEINKTSITLFGLILVIYFMFSSGFIFKIFNDKIPPYAISIEQDNWISWHVYYQSEISGVLWTKKFSTSDYVATINAHPKKNPGLLSEYYKFLDVFDVQDIHIISINSKTRNLPLNVPIYLDKLTTIYKKISGYDPDIGIIYMDFSSSNIYTDYINNASKIYDSNKSWVCIKITKGG